MPPASVGFRAACQAEASSRLGFPQNTAVEILRYGGYVGSVVRGLPVAARLMDLARIEIAACEERGDSFSSGTVYFADQLLSGKGRFQRSWHAPEGGVWMTLVLVNTLLPESTTLLSLAAGVACCEAVRYFGVDACVKWVNDIHVQGRKVAGILAETYVGPMYGEEYILLGIGLNVNNLDFPAELSHTAGSMAMFGEGQFNLEAVRQQLLVKLAWNIGLLHYEEQRRLQEGDLDHGAVASHPLLASWRRVSDTLGKTVCFGFNLFEKIQYTATAVDIDSFGRLHLQLPDGSVVVENAGEIAYVER